MRERERERERDRELKKKKKIICDKLILIEDIRGLESLFLYI